ncbi:PilN domain-containing protein [Bacillus sp. UMB0728]|uniref:PilN domain-containing protein n=1 Tax=Bacillus sp. UMB0728 TaxID=2066052 RepID=UPI000C779B18|nr:fimbrial assembly protein [Bacillus sp. UMB0728]PLR72789.1 fimbrial assembly protein [Bacillus sp. UMB0728]
MLVDINLLPKKEKRSKAAYISLAAAGLAAVILSVSLYIYLGSQKEKIEQVETQIAQTNEILEAQRVKLADYESSNSVGELENAISWAKEQPFSVVYILNEVTKLLPERGYITEFEKDEENKIKQIVQFDTKSQAAYYLNSLLSLGWLDEAVLTEAKTTDVLKDDDEETSAAEEEILPRYFAAYELQINSSLLKQEIEEKEAEGGTAP